MPAGKSLLAVQPVPERPDDPVPQLQAVVFEDRIEEDVEREYLAVVDIVPDLPAIEP